MRVKDEQVKCSGVDRATMQPPSSSSMPLGRSITFMLPSGVETSHTESTSIGAGFWPVPPPGFWPAARLVAGPSYRRLGGHVGGDRERRGELRAILVAQLVVPDDVPDQPVQKRNAGLVGRRRDTVDQRVGMPGALLRRQADIEQLLQLISLCG